MILIVKKVNYKWRTFENKLGSPAFDIYHGQAGLPITLMVCS